MFIEMTDNEMINFNYVATIRKGYSKTYNSFTIYVNTIGEDNVVLQFETEEEMEKKWRWLQHIVPRGEGKGEFYPCKPDIFEQTYEQVGE